MTRTTLRTENQWPYVRDGGGIDLLRIPVSVNRWHVSAGVTLLGFGVGLTWWRMSIPIPADTTAADFVGGFPSGSGEPIQPGQAFQLYEDNWPHNVPRESLGREHAP